MVTWSQSFFRCFVDNVVHIKGLTNSFSKKGQLGGVLVCWSWSFKFSGLISFCQNFFDAHDIKDMISGLFYHSHLHFLSSCLGKSCQGYQLQKMLMSHRLSLMVNWNTATMQHCNNRSDAHGMIFSVLLFVIVLTVSLIFRFSGRRVPFLHLDFLNYCLRLAFESHLGYVGLWEIFVWDTIPFSIDSLFRLL